MKMKLWTPEISWHGKLRILSLDLHPKPIRHEDCTIWKLATGGADNDVKIWNVAVPGRSLEFRSSLNRHSNAVNAVRFSPTGDILASGSDDCGIILWKFNDNKPSQKQTLLEDEQLNKETWSVFKLLRGHTVGVFDLCWSPDSNFILSGSVDNKAIIWDVTKGKPTSILSESNNYVQGVAWDPKSQYIATLSNDRVYSSVSKQLIHYTSKCAIGSGDFDVKPFRIFLEESSLQTFFRRLTFSPDGSLLIVPSGRLEKNGSTVNTTFVFSRTSLGKPAVYLPSPGKPTVAVRCCPMFFQLRHRGSNNNCNALFKLPYRMVFAVATLDTVLLYDTQQTLPIAMIGKIHYATLTDLTWSTDGKLLVVSSSDGYCSLVEFEERELGCPLTATDLQQLNQSSTDNTSIPMLDGSNQQTHQSVAMSVEKPADKIPTSEITPAMTSQITPITTSQITPVMTSQLSQVMTSQITPVMTSPQLTSQITPVMTSRQMTSQARQVMTSPQMTSEIIPVMTSQDPMVAVTTPTVGIVRFEDPTVSSSSGTGLMGLSRKGQEMKEVAQTTPNGHQLVPVTNTTPQSGGHLKPRRLPLSALKTVH